MKLKRRDFIHTSTAALAAGAVQGLRPARAEGAPDRLLRHRFGMNYVPSRNWYFCWNDWRADDIASDFDRIAELGADHLRIMLIWPWFQPNRRVVSGAHLDRLEELLRLAAARKLDVLVTLYTGWLSGFRFVPPFLEKEPFFTSPQWAEVQGLYLTEVSKRLVQHANFLGYDIGNEINCCWSCSPEEGDAWMTRVFRQMQTECPGRVHVNGVDHNPWFRTTTFSPKALMAQQELVTLHCWPFWTGAGKFGGHLDKPYTRLPAAMAALARSHGQEARKPVWLQEFGACNAEMPEADVPRWLELAITSGIEEGVSWFTWWASHDVDPRFDFNPFEYGLGLMTVDNKIKEQGRAFKRLADAYRSKPVVIPTVPLPPPPEPRTTETTWRWILDWLGVKK